MPLKSHPIPLTPKKKLQVFHLLPIANYGGGPLALLHFLSASKALKLPLLHSVVIQKAHPTLFQTLKKNADHVYALPLASWSLFTLKALFNLLRAKHPQLLHTHGKGPALYVLVLKMFFAKFLKKITVVHTFHGYHPSGARLRAALEKQFWRLFTRRAEALISLSKAEHRKVLQDFPHLREKLNLIPNGIPEGIPEGITEPLAGLASDEKETVPTHSKIAKVTKNYSVNLVSFARLSPQKNLLFMLEGFAAFIHSFHSASSAIPQSSLALHLFAGPVPGQSGYAAKVKALCSKINVSLASSNSPHKIFLWDPVPKVAQLLPLFQIYLSTAKWEGLPLALLEAMQAEVLIVASAVAGNSELALDGTTALTFPLSQPPHFLPFHQALQRALHLQHHPMQKQKILLQAKNLRQNKFSAEAQARALLRLYQTLCPPA